MVTKISSLWKDNRGAVIVETALVVPIYLVLLLICLDIPHLMLVKQRLIGVNRLSADLVCRGANHLPPEAVKLLFFADSSRVDANGIQNNPETPQKTRVHNLVKEFIDGEWAGPVGKVSSLVINIVDFLTGSLLTKYLENLFATDLYHAANFDARIKLLLPQIAYKGWLKQDKTEFVVDAWRPCYMPNSDTFQSRPNSLAGTISSFISDLL